MYKTLHVINANELSTSVVKNGSFTIHFITILKVAINNELLSEGLGAERIWEMLLDYYTNPKGFKVKVQ